MGYAQTCTHRWRYFIQCAAIGAATLLTSTVCAAQAKPSPAKSEIPWLQEMTKNPELMAEFGRLCDRLQHDLQYPTPRSESRLLPLMPDATMSYAAFPNFGEVVHQALEIFRQERQQNAALRDWWQHGEVATAGPKVEDSFEKIYQLSQYLGDEIVVTGAMETRDPKLLIVAEVRKPGLKNFLQQMLTEIAGKSKLPVHILEPQELATAEAPPAKEPLVLVRPDYVVATLDLATLRSFNARLDRHSRDFALTPFGQRVAHAYEGGATVLAAADLHKIMSQLPQGTPRDQMILQRTGFADVQYFVWEHRNSAGHPLSQTELSFTGPRHGVASWLAAPAPLGSLDFVSPKAMLVGTLLLVSPAKIFEDVKELTTASNPNAFAGLEQMELALNLSLKDDLLSLLGGEITGELDSLTLPENGKKQEAAVSFRANEQTQGAEPEPAAVWKAILRASDPTRLQQTFTTLLALVHIAPEQVQDGGIAYYKIHIPSAKKPVEISYAFADGYLIVGSSRQTVAEGIRLHAGGEPLGKSKKFLASLPPSHSSDASGLLYEDPVAITALTLRQAGPELAGPLAQLANGNVPPVVACAYGEETSIRSASTSAAMDMGVVMIVAAIAIPNLLRSRMAANEAAAVGTIRVLNTAQMAYAADFPERGFAPDLATLGPDPSGKSAVSAEHGNMIDSTLGNASCTAGAWCTKSGYRFTLAPGCEQKPCKKYVVTATPVDSSTGGRSFCSTSDAVIRFKLGPPLSAPVSAAECQSWAPLH